MEISEQLLDANKLFEKGDYKNALLILDAMRDQKVILSWKDMLVYMVCLRERLRYKESSELALKILQKDETNEQALLNLCICCGKQGEYIKALTYYNSILKRNSEFREQYGYYAYLLYQNGRLEESEAAYQEALEREKDNVWYISHYALLAEKLGKNEKALMLFEEALKLTPKDTWLIKEYVFLCGKSKGKEFGYSYYDGLINENSTNYNLYINYAEYAIVHDDLTYAKHLLEKVVVEELPVVMQVIFNIYYGVILLYQDDIESFQHCKTEIIKLRKTYNAYVHRDFSFLTNYVKEKFSVEKQEQYSNLLDQMKEE